MQEPINQEQTEQAPAARKPTFAIVVAAIALVVVLAAASIVQLAFSGSYNQALDKLKGMVTTASGQFEAGDEAQGATLSDEYRFYAGLDAQIKTFSTILAKLNESYPLYLFRADERSSGIAALSEKMEALSPKLEGLKASVDEDKAIAREMKKLLTGDAQEGQSQQYSGLITRNGKLKEAVSGLAFTGAAEAGRVAFASAIEARGKALECLREDAAINEELKLTLSDTATPFATNVDKLKALQTRSDALAANLSGVDLSVYGPNGGKVAELAAGRSDRIKTDIDYLGQLGPLQSEMAAFCAGLNTTPEGKLAAKMKTYSDWIKQLKTLEGKLNAVNADKKYAGADLITVEALGMTAAGKELLGYEKALSDASAAFSASASIEKQINAIMKDTKSRMVSKVSKLSTLAQQNQSIITAFSADLPAGLRDQAAKFISACKERATFLDDYMNYVIAKDNSDNAGRSYHSNTGVTQAQYNAAVKATNDAKKKADASHKKYVPLLNV